MALDLLAAGQLQADVAGLGTLRRDVLDAHRAEQLDLVAGGLCDESLARSAPPTAVGEAGVVVDALGDAGWPPSPLRSITTASMPSRAA